MNTYRVRVWVVVCWSLGNLFSEMSTPNRATLLGDFQFQLLLLGLISRYWACSDSLETPETRGLTQALAVFHQGYMHQKLCSRLTAAALILSALGVSTASYASQPGVTDEGSELNVPVDETSSAFPTTSSPDFQTGDVAKVGEYQSQENSLEGGEAAIATIHPHEMNGRQAATLYVNTIPVLTFLGSSSTTSDVSPIPESADTLTSSSEVKVGSIQSESSPEGSLAVSSDPTASSLVDSQTVSDNTSDAVWRASEIAAQINQLYQNRIDAETITVRWDADRERYLIEVNGEELVEINTATILPDSNGDPAEDALQATNRLRRLIGNAPPLSDIAGRPQPPQEVSLGPIQFQVSGVASWYGPGFDGRRSASGEVFDQDALTAAHRTLPFGTMVRVTNVSTGQSVVVRINDRGPYSGRRIIDLSAGAARAIGMIASGTARVNLEVLGTITASASTEQ